MKKLLKTLPILLVFVIASGFGLKNITDGIKVDNDRIEVVFNRTMDFNDLVKVKLDLSEKGISINYRLLEFDEKGGLKSLDFKVDCNDGFSGGAKKTDIYNQTKFGFYRDYSEKSDSPFGTGNLK